MLLSLIRWTQNSPAAVIPQILSRLFIVWVVFPLVPSPSATPIGTVDTTLKSLPVINGTLVCWAVTEVIRYAFYTFKDMAVLKHLRYNLFLVLYPLGVSCELLSIAHSCLHVKHDFTPGNQPLTLTMPNTVNFIFKYEWSIWICLLVYSVEFPKLFTHMMRQRSKVYAIKSKD